MPRTYYSINVTNKCNKNCSYCINAEYVNNPEYPDIMKFEDLINWLENEINEDDIVEIAGTGEPTLCEWLPNLLHYLENKMVWTKLRTNGFKLGQWRKDMSRLLVIMAQHDSSNDYMNEKRKFLMPNDLILTQITDQNKQAKNDAASKIVDFFPDRSHNVKRAFFITPDGKIRFMPCQSRDMGTVWNYIQQGWTCTEFNLCSFVVNAYNFVEYLKKPFEIPQGIDYMQVKNWRKDKWKQ